MKIVLDSGDEIELVQLFCMDPADKSCLFLLRIDGDITRSQMDSFRAGVGERFKKIFGDRAECMILNGIQGMEVIRLTDDDAVYLKNILDAMQNNQKKEV